MAKRSTTHSRKIKRAEEYKIGQKVLEPWIEKEMRSVGRIASICRGKNKVYMLLVTDNREYTIYSSQTGCVCKPVVARYIPEYVVRYLYTEAFSSEDSPIQRYPVLFEPEKKTKQLSTERLPKETEPEERESESKHEECLLPVFDFV